MEIDSIQMTLIAIFLASAVAMVVVCDFLRKTFFRPAVQHHTHGRHRHGSPLFEGQTSFESPAMRSSPALSEFAKRSAVPVNAEEVTWESKPEPIETLTLAEPQVPVAPSPLQERAVDDFLWEQVQEAAAAAFAHGPSAQGMLSQADWQQTIAVSEPFTGIAVSISINDIDGSMWHNPAVMRSVSRDIAGLLGDHGFGCRTAFDEFVLICPQEQDRPGRLKQITTRLWECQLRGQRAGSVRITWGGVAVKNQPLAEAIASAADRMRQSQRTSESIFAASAAAASVAAVAVAAAVSCRPRRKAV